ETVLIASDDRGPRGRRVGVTAVDRATGEVRYDRPAGLCDGYASRVLVDDLLVANSETGELVAIDARDGSTRYRHVFAGGQRADRPQSLQPVLRSGALFLPQSELYVVRPGDGAIIGRIPGGLVPDVLRVDEQC